MALAVAVGDGTDAQVDHWMDRFDVTDIASGERRDASRHQNITYSTIDSVDASCWPQIATETIRVDPPLVEKTRWLLCAATSTFESLRRNQDATRLAERLDAASAIERLRAWTGLSIGELADYLGVARRSLYHWSSGRVGTRKEARLLALASAIQPLAETWEPWRIRNWLIEQPNTRELARSGDVTKLAERALEAARPERLLLRPVEAGNEEVEAFDAETVLRYYASATSARRPATRSGSWTPRELIDSAEEEEEE